MYDNKLLNKVIDISSLEIKAGKFGKMAKLKDENGFTYTVYEQKKDGSTSAAWELLQELNVGDSVQISYVEEPKEFEGKKYMARTIRNFDKDIGTGVRNSERYQTAPRQETRPRMANFASSGPSNDSFGRRLALHGFVNARLVNHSIDVVAGEIDSLLKLEDKIDRQLHKGPVSNEPVIHRDDNDEPIDVSDIPF